jgi:surfeit locus 1 family protein
MLQRLRQAGLIGPTLAALAALLVLVGLGTWQLERKRWKEHLIATIAARVHADPVPLVGADGLLPAKIDHRHDYLHVAATGRFHHDKERYLYAPTPAGPGWHVYTPLEFLPGHVVWVNRGLVPEERKAPETRPQGQVPGLVEVRGLARLPAGRAAFSPPNDPERNVWYWPDLAAMSASAFPGGLLRPAGGPQRADPLPLVIEADAKPEPPGGLPRGGVTRLALPNRHLGYALTWYGVALTLIGVYSAFVINRLRTHV